MKHVGVDIIIPIFNAYDDVLKCVESVWKWTDLKTHRLVLVNDCSTDTRIMPYLERQKVGGSGCHTFEFGYCRDKRMGRKNVCLRIQ